MNTHRILKFSWQGALVIGLLPLSLLACGSNSGDESGGTGGSAGQGAGGDAGTHTGGNGPTCPAAAPSTTDDCQQDVNPAGCTYSDKCTSGETNRFNFRCADDGHWRMSPQTCEHQHEYCRTIPVGCDDQGEWGYLPGLNPGTLCPALRPEVGSACTPNENDCGFFCPDASTWTLMFCDGTKWVSDGACD